MSLLGTVLAAAKQEPAQTSLPALPAGQHMGLNYTLSSDAGRPAVDALWNRCHREGLSTMQLNLSWADLESKPGEIDTAQLEMLLSLCEVAGLRPYVVLGAIDQKQLGVPADLRDAANANQLATDEGWADPALQQRMSNLLTRCLPLIAQYGGFHVSLGTRVDQRIFRDAHTTNSFASFLSSARATAQRIAPSLSIGASVGWQGLRAHPQRFQVLRAAADNLALVYIPMGPNHEPSSPSQVSAQLQEMLDAVAPGPLLLEEFGYPSGSKGADSKLSTPAAQSDFIDACFRSFTQQPRIRYANHAGVSDWGPREMGILQLEHNITNLNDIECLQSLGLSWQPSGEKKPAYTAFVQGLKRMQASRR